MKKGIKIISLLAFVICCICFNQNVYAETVSVGTQQELLDALERSDVSEISISNNIKLEEITKIELSGQAKKIEGNNYVISSDNTINITANDELTISNIELNFSGTINLSTNSTFENVKSLLDITSSSGKVVISNSEFESVSISDGDNSQITNSNINNGLSIYTSIGFVVDNVNIKSTYNGITIGHGNGSVGGKITNTTIDATQYGIYTDLYGKTLELDNVKISNSEYGIYQNISHNGRIKLKDVEIIDSSKHAIYQSGDNGYSVIELLDNSRLQMDTGSNVAIMLQNGGSLDIGNNVEIEHTGTNYTVYKDSTSTLVDNSATLKEIKDISGRKYYLDVDKETSDIIEVKKEVSTETELIENLNNSTVTIIELKNNIEIKDIESSYIYVEGAYKEIIGNNYTISTTKSWLQIIAHTPIIANGVTLTGIAMKLQNGGILDNITMTKSLDVETSSSITNSHLESLTLSVGDNSQIKNCNIDNGLTIYKSIGFVVDNVNIKSTYNGITIGHGNGNVGGKITNTAIEAANYGIYTDLYGEILELDNVSVKNSEYGIYQNISHGGRIELKDIEIINSKKNAIYQSGNSGYSTIGILENSKLQMDTGSNIAIVLQNGGRLNIGSNVEIEHIGTNYTVYKDSVSEVVDNSATLKEVKDISGRKYYLDVDKEASDIIEVKKEVSTEAEFIENLKDVTVTIIELKNNIEIEDIESSYIYVEGSYKEIIGNNYTISTTKSWLQIIAHTPIIANNITLTGIAIKLQNGGTLDNITMTEALDVETSSVITNSNLESLTLNTGDNSLIEKCNINNGLKINNSVGFVVDDVNVKSTFDGIRVAGGGRVGGKIINTTIEASDYGIYTSLYNETLELDNVKILNCEYGIYQKLYSGSTINLKDVEIINPSKYAIYQSGEPGYYETINILDNAKLKLDTGSNAAIVLQNGGRLNIGNNVEIEHIGTNYTVYKASNSSLTMSQNTLFKKEIENSTWEGYYTKANYPDVTKPEISLNGENIEYVRLGSTYTEKGATAIDDIDGTIDVTIEGIVNTSAIGIYEITYTAIDSHGNSNSITRTVVVYESAIESPLTIEIGQTIKLNHIFKPTECFVNENITWATSDEKLATVDSEGNVTAIGRGTVTITAITSSGIVDSCTITVLSPIKGITINEKDVILIAGKNKQLTVSINPETTTDDRTIIWTSSDETVAKVDVNGNVTAISRGTAIVTATSVNGKTSTTEITVIDPKVLTLEVEKTVYDLTIDSDEFTITPEITTQDNPTYEVVWTSSNENVVTVKDGKVTVVGTGSATITVTALDKKVEITVNVTSPIKGITINEKDVTLIVGKNKQLTVSINPETTTDDRTIIWTSSDETVAKVDVNGNVTAIGRGTAIVTATSVNGKTTTIEITVEEPKEISDATSTAVENQEYTGKEIIPNITVSYGETTLVEGIDYLVEYKNNINPGTASIVITGINKYTGTKVITFEINNPLISNANISEVDDVKYTGNAHTPGLYLIYNGKELVLNVDYTLSYSNNINAGVATITIKGIGLFVGEATVTFNILPKELSEVTLYDIADIEYSGEANTPVVALSDGNYTLLLNKDFTVEYKDNIDIGTMTIEITGMGNYIGGIIIKINIVRIDISKATVEGVEDKTFNWVYIYQDLVVKYGDKILTKYEDYTLEYKNNINIGNATITITGVGIYTGTKTVTFEILPIDIANAKADNVYDYTYTGEEIKPFVNLTYNDWNYLSQGVDYTVEYKNNIEIGIASIIITGKGNYTGTKIITFKILPPYINSLNFSYEKKFNYNKQEIRPNVEIKYKDYILVEGKDYTLDYENNIYPGMATIKVTGQGDYRGTTTLYFEIYGDFKDVKFETKVIKCTKDDGVNFEFVLTIDGYVIPKNHYYYVGGCEYPDLAKRKKAKGDGIIKSWNYYTGEMEVKYNVAYDIADATVTGVKDKTYTGSALTQSITVKYGKTTLKKEKDYTISYKNNVNAGVAILVLKGKGAFGFTKEITFNINPRSVSGLTYSKIDNLPYTGLVNNPKLTITNGKIKLVEGTDYTIEYKDNIDRGTGIIVVTGKGNYTGTKEVAFKIGTGSIKLAKVEGLAVKYYTGKPLTQDLVLTYNGYTLKEGVDYTLSYKNNVKVGKATVTITGKGNFILTNTLTFKIKGKNINGVDVAYGESMAYTGKARNPKVTLTDNGVTLKQDKDYKVSYKNNVYPGTGKIIITGIGNYSETRELTYTINPRSIAAATVKGLADKGYTGGQRKQSLTLTYNKKTLKEGRDYTIRYENNVEVGTATVIITGKGNFGGEHVLTYKINRRSVAGLTFSKVKNYTYTGKEVTPNVKVTYGKYTLVKDQDYTVTYSKNVNVGTASITIKGIGSFSGSKTIKFKITPRSISSAEIAGLVKKEYTGKSIKQNLTLTYNGMTLKYGTDYTISYKNNKNIGKATLTIKGKGNFKSSVTKTFNIIPVLPVLTNLEVTNNTAKLMWNRISHATGYVIYISEDGENFKTLATITKYKTTSYTVKKLKDGEYTFKIRAYKTVGRKKYYSNYSEALTCNVGLEEIPS